MRLLFCIMGDICNGKYEIYQYLIDAYKFKPYKTFTTKKIKRNPKFDTFEEIDLLNMKILEGDGDIVGLKKIRGHHYGKRISALESGFSVCVSDYMGYLELAQKFYTVPVLIKRSRLKRFLLEDCDVKQPTDFLAYENLNKKQYEFALEDKNLIILEPKTMIDLKLQIDKIVDQYLEDISYDVDITYEV